MKLNVSLRITDTSTNQPTPVRLRITDSDGGLCPPLGRLPTFATARGVDVGGHLRLGEASWCYIDGACEVPLPGGEQILLEATKGLEYTPVKQAMTLGAGQMALRQSISRWIDMRSEGWYSGDTRCHFLPPHATLLEGRAEDLSVVNLLASEEAATELQNSSGEAVGVLSTISNLLAFSGQHPCLAVPDCVVAVNTINTHRVLGKLALLHCHRIVFPLNFGAPFGTDDWSLLDWCDQCHRKNGLVVWCDPFAPNPGFAPEALADLVLGRIDAVEITPETGLLHELYDWWSAGIRAPIVGASGKDSNAVALGAVRTYAKIAPTAPLTYTNWIEAVRTGNTFVTSGPILEFTVDGQPPGTVLNRDMTAAPLKLRASVRSATLPGPLEILDGGEVIARTDQFGSGPIYSATLEREYSVATSTWLAARCVALPSTQNFAHTSSVVVQVAGKPLGNPNIARRLIASLEKTCEWVETKGRFEQPRRRENLLTRLHQAQQRLRS